MADDRKSQDRPVKRSFECHRLQDQLWSLAYQHVLPVIRRKLQASGAINNQHRYEAPCANAKKTRRA